MGHRDRGGEFATGRAESPAHERSFTSMARPPASTTKRRRTAVRCLVALSSCCVVFNSEPRADTGDAILSAIENLESGNDAKCHSSASRFEDFLCGTPLSEAARRSQIQLQMRLVSRIWGDASRSAARAGKKSVGAERIRQHGDDLFRWESDADGQIHVTFPDAAPVTLSKLRAEQYGSIAYSLRAILAVQQESLLWRDDLYLTLEPEGVDRLREAIDTVTLSALMLADREARARSEFEISEATIRAVWQRLVPESTRPSEVASSAFDATLPPSADRRALGLRLLEEMIDRKLAAYRVYNELDGAKTQRRFMVNIGRFFARNPLPATRAGREAVGVALAASLDQFSVALLLEATARANRAGHRQIRAEDATRAVQQLIPHEIDEFEDLHFFGRLDETDRIHLEAYDCDSFRDFGAHWPPLKRALRRVPETTPLPDPFAAEILAEAISHYGVLILRVAGVLARQDTDNPRLEPGDFASSAARIRHLAQRHRETPIAAEAESHIVSAAGESQRERPRLFFTEVTDSAGVEFRHRSSRWLGEFRHQPLNTPPTFSGGGVAAEDIDGDGHIDLLFVGGGGNAVLINDGRGHFTDVTEQAGIALLRPDGSHGEARKPIIADFDNDGRQDILITYANDDHRLYRNLGGLRFQDVSSHSGLGGKGLIGGPATVFDFDGDGLLDIYIGFMGDYLSGAVPALDRDNRNALPNQLFRNRGGLRFENVSEGSGASDTGWTQAVSHTDIDRDGRQDIIVANDFGRNAFLRNLGGGRFEDVAPALGVTQAFHSMNVGISDLNADGHPDIYISNIATLIKDNKYSFPDVNTPMKFDPRAVAGMLVKESDMLYMSQTRDGRLVAYAPSTDVERGETSTGWAWDAEFFDFDHDGDDDLYVVNGKNDFNTNPLVYNHPAEDGRIERYLLSHSRESNVFFVNDGGKLRNRSAHSGADFVGNSRSTAYLDFDGDGDLDIVVNNFHAPAKLLRNNSEGRGPSWLKIRLIGDPQRASNRDAIGARVLVTADGGLQQSREVQGGSGYLSMNPKQQHFGLGGADSADVRITWPNGEVQILRGVAANRAYTVRQGVGSPTPDPARDGRREARVRNGDSRGMEIPLE
jgi:hypothetical protein